MTGPEVRAIRRKYGFSQDEFGRMLGVHRNTVYGWEKNGISEIAYVLARNILSEADRAIETAPDRQAFKVRVQEAIRYGGNPLDGVHAILGELRGDRQSLFAQVNSLQAEVERLRANEANTERWVRSLLGSWAQSCR